MADAALGAMVQVQAGASLDEGLAKALDGRVVLDATLHGRGHAARGVSAAAALVADRAVVEATKDWSNDGPKPVPFSPPAPP
jgi:hypothetical protein